MGVGENIRKYRKLKGFTQKKLAELAKLNEVTIRSYEAGKYKPKLEQLHKIAEALEIPLHQLTDGDYSSFSPKDLQEDFIGGAIPLNDFHNMVVDKALEDENGLLSNYRILNTEGRTEARKRVAELTEIKRYTEISN